MAMQRNHRYVIPETGPGSKPTPKQQRFVEEYMIDLNGTKAVIRAGYKTKNPNRMAAEMLTHPLVKRMIQEEKDKRASKSELTAEFLIQKLISVIGDADEKTADVLRAVELAGRTLGIFRDRQEISGPDGDAIQVKEQRIAEDVSDFKSRIAGIAARGGKSTVVGFPKSGSPGES